MLSWLGIQRGKMILDENARVGAEQERDAAYRERDTDLRSLNEQIMKAQSAQATSESKLEAALSANANDEEECKAAKAQIEHYEREIAALRATPAVAGGFHTAIGQLNAFLLSEPGGSGARLKETARALLPSLTVNRRGVDDEFEVRALWVAVWPDLECFHGSNSVAILLPFFQGNPRKHV